MPNGREVIPNPPRPDPFNGGTPTRAPSAPAPRPSPPTYYPNPGAPPGRGGAPIIPGED